MSGWSRTTMKDIVLGLYDGPHATPPVADDGPVFLGIGNVTEDGHLDLSQVRHIAEEDFGAWTKRIVPAPGDIVFTYEATLNRYAIIPTGFRGCLGRRMALIRPDERKVDTRFLFYTFFGAAWRETIEAHRLSGATVDRIPLSKFPSFPIDLPDLVTQCRIAEILGAYDDLIKVNRRRVALLEDMARGLFEEWFVRFRFPGHEAVAMVETPDGFRPSTWSLVRLDDILVLQRGFDLPAPVRSVGPYFVISASGRHGTHTEAKVKGPGVVTGRSGTIGKVHLIFEDHWPLNTTLYVKQFKRGGPAFARQLLVHLDLASSSSGSAVPTLNRNHVHGLQIAVASDDVLDRYEATAMGWLTLANTLNNQSETLAACRDLLLPRLISGQLSVAAAECELLEAA